MFGFTAVSCSNIKKDYEIRDASYLPAPKWVKEGKQKSSSKDEYKYFVSKAENVNQRLCERTANTRANLVVASEIANVINSAYENVINSNADEYSEISNEKLQQNVNIHLAGVQNEESYWEKRQYLVQLGASKDVVKYQCYSLVKMNKENYDKAVNLSLDKMMSSISNDKKAEIKEDVKNEIIKNED